MQPSRKSLCAFRTTNPLTSTAMGGLRATRAKLTPASGFDVRFWKLRPATATRPGRGSLCTIYLQLPKRPIEAGRVIHAGHHQVLGMVNSLRRTHG
jgi:hypothetical protein